MALLLSRICQGETAKDQADNKANLYLCLKSGRRFIINRYKIQTEATPRIADGSRTAFSVKPINFTNGIINHVCNEGFQSPKDLKDTGEKIPCSSLPVCNKEKAL